MTWALVDVAIGEGSLTKRGHQQCPFNMFHHTSELGHLFRGFVCQVSSVCVPVCCCHCYLRCQRLVSDQQGSLWWSLPWTSLLEPYCGVPFMVTLIRMSCTVFILTHRVLVCSLLGVFVVGFLTELLKRVVSLLPLFSETLIWSYIMVYHLQHRSWAPGSAHRY